MSERPATFPDRRVAVLARFMPAVRAVHNPVVRDGLLWHLRVLTAVPELELFELLHRTIPRQDDAAIAVLRSLYPRPPA